MRSARRTIVVGIVVLLVALGTCVSALSTKPDFTGDELAKRVGPFGMQLFNKLWKAGDGKNVFISPLSVHLALDMAYNGATGATKAAMAKALGLGGLSLENLNAGASRLIADAAGADPKVTLSIANSIWYRQDERFLPAFLERNRLSFRAEVRALDFDKPRSVDVINGWISDKTAKMIPSMLESIERDSVMFLVNAIYFNGEWKFRFDPAKTRPRTFAALSGARRDVPLMRQDGTYLYYRDTELEAVTLPYGGGRCSMLVVLPRPGRDFRRFAEGFDWARLEAVRRAVREREGSVELPRFKLEYGKVDLRRQLAELGMGQAFGRGADFSGMNGRRNLSISQVLHKAVLEVDERGTKAAAVTVVTMRKSAVHDENGPFRFLADRPFFFAIMDNASGALLFCGALAEVGP